MLILSLVCAVVGHRSRPSTRHSYHGNSFARCRLCSQKIFHDPKRERWRLTRAADLRPRHLSIIPDEVGDSDA